MKKRILITALSALTSLSAFAGGHQPVATQPTYHEDTTSAVLNHIYLTSGIGSAAVSIGAPNAAGSGTNFFLSGSYVSNWPLTNSDDGLMGIGISFGNPYRSLGVLFNVALTRLGANGTPIGRNGTFGIRFNHYIIRHLAVAFGVSTAAGWGDTKDTFGSYYGAATYTLNIPRIHLPVILNAGVGKGSYNADAQPLMLNKDKVNGFVGLSVGLMPGLFVISDYAADQFNIGATYSIMAAPELPFFISISGRNLNKYQHSRSYFQASAGFSYVMIE